jgi:shikimate dehydrogenase
MTRFCLIGNPIAHSESPTLFRASYNEKDFSYSLLECSTIEKAMSSFNAGGYLGANITSPFKERVMSYIQYPDIISCRLGAANTIIKSASGLKSYNTDYYGVMEIITKLREAKINKSIVIGAGGAGKAAALALKNLGMKVTIANRTPQKISEFAKKSDIDTTSLDNMTPYIMEAQLIIYALSMPIEQLTQQMLSGKILLEANYATPNYKPSEKSNPHISYRNGLQFEQNLGMVYISGKEWLLHQAVKAFELFTGTPPNIISMRHIL